MTAATVASGRPSSWSTYAVLAVSIGATLLALAIRWLAEIAGIEKQLFGFATGVGELDAPAQTIRTAIYPLFIAALKPFGMTVILAVQSFLYFVAGILVFARLAWFLPPPRWLRWITALAAVAAMYNPRVLEYPLSISEEALFIPGMMGLIAALLAYLAKLRLSLAVLAGVLAGLVIGVRPIGVAFLPMLFVALLVPLALRGAAGATWRRAGLAILIAGAGVIVALTFEWAAHRAMVGDSSRITVFGANVVGKVPFIIEKGDLTSASNDPREAEAIRGVEAVLVGLGEFAARADAALATWDGRQFFTNYAEFAFQMRTQSPELGVAMQRLADVRGQPPQIVVADVAMAVIWKRPLRFAARVFGNLGRSLALAEMPSAAGREDVDKLALGVGKEWFAGRPGEGYKRVREVAQAYRLPAWGLRLAHAAALIGLALSLVFAVYAGFRRQKLAPAAAIGILIGLGFFGYLLLLALVINAQVRYVLTVWPMTVLLALLGLVLLARVFGARASQP